MGLELWIQEPVLSPNECRNISLLGIDPVPRCDTMQKLKSYRMSIFNPSHLTCFHSFTWFSLKDTISYALWVLVKGIFSLDSSLAIFSVYYGFQSYMCLHWVPSRISEKLRVWEAAPIACEMDFQSPIWNTWMNGRVLEFTTARQHWHHCKFSWFNHGKGIHCLQCLFSFLCFQRYKQSHMHTHTHAQTHGSLWIKPVKLTMNLSWCLIGCIWAGKS